MSTYKLSKTETKNKAGKFLYQVKDEKGNVISERRSNREYVACTINGQYYFGRLDLIGKGDHGKQIKYNEGYRQKYDKRRKEIWEKVEGAEVKPQTPIAYLG